ncbi:NUDIX hydrolase [Rhizobium sp. S163]|uniref:NUDIX hydrolase n=1 Tax=Rhizobium sp. S163 TaxID=3055039 RepID=UPI000DBA10EB|nr:NUDIX hydrolase [Rhizobium sp. S163]MDM9644866.1 NUDIX hydrolase [Rhizobium sp. S163]
MSETDKRDRSRLRDGDYPKPAPVEQFGALCLRSGAGGTEILLITTRQTKRWTIPKGWPIRGMKPHRVAECEAWEEAGVEGRARRRSVGSFTYMKTLDDGVRVPATVDVHLLDVRRCNRIFPERKERTLAWLAPGKAARLVAEPELQKILRKLDLAR